MNPLLNLVLVALFGVTAGPAIAAETVPIARVGFSDLDLTSEAGVNRLEQRVGRAVRKVCATGARSLEDQRWERRCKIESAARASVGIAGAIRGAQSSGAWTSAKAKQSTQAFKQAPAPMEMPTGHKAFTGASGASKVSPSHTLGSTKTMFGTGAGAKQATGQ